MRNLFLWACYRMWLLIPVSYVFSRPATWLLQYAGEYANRPEPNPMTDTIRTLLRQDEAAVLQAIADYLAESYVPEPGSRNEVAMAIRRHLEGDDGGC